MNNVVESLIVVGSISAVMGIFIAISSKFFYVKVDERIEIIYEMLPHFNCGACGTPGCMPMAEELVAGNILIAKCRPCKPEQRDKITEKLLELGIDIAKG